MSVKIYHFCADRDLKNILQKGLIIGGVLVPGIFRKGLIIGGVFVPGNLNWTIYTGYTWLTYDGMKSHQSWATRILIKHDRTAWRLTVEIPDDKTDRLYDRDGLEEILPGTRQLFDGWPGSECWRVYKGIIPPEWIKEAVRPSG